MPGPRWLLSTLLSAAVAGAGCGADRSPVTDCAGNPPPRLDERSSVLLSWQAPERRTDGSSLDNLVGYRIYTGRDPAALRPVVEICSPAATSWVVGGLSPGTWHFSLTAIDDRNVESDPTAVVTRTID